MPDAEFKPKYCILTGLVLLAGLITQYYFVFYAFFLCAAYVIYALVKREYKGARVVHPLRARRSAEPAARVPGVP